ncbi:MAG: prolyl oligopeptidase family serine peptidase [Bacteroidales bacterium]|nr:prolyl oligopeptidase family serine peptidase [Bacteroidales bacterium]
MNRTFLLLSLLMISFRVMAQDHSVAHFLHAGPFPLQQPVMLDSTDVDAKPFDTASLLQTPLRLENVRRGRAFRDAVLPKDAQGRPALHLLSFVVTNTSYAKAKVMVKGLSHHILYVDGKVVQTGAETELLPATHEVVIKALTTAESKDSVQVNIVPTKGSDFMLSDACEGQRLYTMAEVLHARRYAGVSLSPDGRWAIVATTQTQPGGRTQRQTEVREVATGRIVDQRDGVVWMPTSNLYYYTRMRGGKRELVSVDPLSQSEQILADNIPEGYFQMTPTEDRLVFTLYDEAPQERPDVYEVIHPDDRQPGWRTRSHLAVYDLQAGILQPLTFGHSRTSVADLSQDGRYALVMTAGSRLGKRPTEVASLYRINLSTLHVDTLLSNEGFMGNACFSPDGSQVLLTGSPEALGGIGKKVGEGFTPSMIDMQIFVMDIDHRKVKPMTCDFDPNVGQVVWSNADGKVYIKAEDKDSINLFVMDPRKGSFQRLELPEEVVEGFDVAAKSPVMILYGQSASNSDRLYAIDLTAIEKKGLKAVRLIEDLSAETLKNVVLGACEPYVYVNEKGEQISCRYYLPPHFDASKKYPMIVNYYGGCSPTSRHFESRYPQHAYAALGYIVLVVNPRGATGFGQEWSAQHVNTAGQGVAEDIIGAVKAFCNEHAWVNDKKIGCIGASYGGFMTQYLQTQTDLFAAAISHAGISDHTSYWGEGYWGYSYSEVSMANSYPWTRKDLYVEQSPLFNADKIRTPLLFVHGDSDHNVPVGESIQMYTALKLLGRPTAMVLVKDQDHHILDYEKRLRWQQTIWAWFARWLQDDATWWQAMYPDKDL